MTTRLSAGDAAPDFTLSDADGQQVSLSDFAGQRVIVYFYPAAMTPGCTTQAVDFTAAMDDLSAAGLHVLGVSPDAPARATLGAYGAYGEKLLYGKLVEGVIRSTFVVDVDAKGAGTVAVAQYNVRAAGHVAKLRRELGL